jgi:LmbE family N-acetylglucosaminyl deacetylase
MLVVLAHPDDETFGLGGTLALYAMQGVKVHLICATRGEVGTVAPEFMEGYSSIADLRVDELLCASELLGLEQVHFLDYRDSGMEGTADNEHPKALAHIFGDCAQRLCLHLILWEGTATRIISRYIMRR